MNLDDLEPPLVSVIMPVRNGESFVAAALESIVNQSYKAIEVIVVDDGSTDDTAVIVSKFLDSDRITLHRTPPLGAWSARNYAMRVASGVYIAFQDADDISMPERIALQVNAAQQAQIVFGMMVEFQGEFNSFQRRHAAEFEALKVQANCPGVMLVHRNIAEGVGEFETGLALSSFIDWHMRALDMGVNVAVVPDVILARRVHNANSTLSGRENLADEYLRTIRKGLQRRKWLTSGDPTLSVIIPTYNAAAYLRDAIESVLNQSYKPIQLIVIDDGSTDDSAEIAQLYPQLRYVYQSHQGVATARNRGIAEAKSEYIAFHDADDICELHRFERQIELLLDNPTLDVVYSQIQNFLDTGTLIPTFLKAPELLIPRMGFVSSLTARTQVFKKFGDFNEELSIGEDVDWMIRAQESMYRACTIPEVLIRRRLHDGNISSNIEQSHKSLAKILLENVRRKRQTELSQKDKIN